MEDQEYTTVYQVINQNWSDGISHPVMCGIFSTPDRAKDYISNAEKLAAISIGGWRYEIKHVVLDSPVNKF